VAAHRRMKPKRRSIETWFLQSLYRPSRGQLLPGSQIVRASGTRSLAEAAPDPEVRARFLRLAKLFELEGRIVAKSKMQVFESKEMLARAAHTLLPCAVTLPPARPCRRNSGTGMSTPICRHYRAASW
jgi:hypothetical protein